MFYKFTPDTPDPAFTTEDNYIFETLLFGVLAAWLEETPVGPAPEREALEHNLVGMLRALPDIELAQRIANIFPDYLDQNYPAMQS